MQTIRYLLNHNAWQSLLEALCVACATMGLLLLLRWLVCTYLGKLAARTGSRLGAMCVDALAKTHWLVLLIAAVHVGANQLALTATMDKLLDNCLMVALTLQGGLWFSKAMMAWLSMRAEENAEANNPAMVTHLALAGFVLRLLVWVVVVLSILSNLGFNITAMVTSLGIGGVAVALAVQNILGDLFASMSIALDKPFVVGDAIVVDTISGTVKHVGLKSTRVQADSGEEVVFANADLLKSRIRNYKRMDERRALFNFSVLYTTSPALLRRIPEIVESIVRDQPQTRFDRAHLKALGPNSLDFEVVYFMLKPDYRLFADTQQHINIELLERFLQEGIRFASPTGAVANLFPAAADVAPFEAEPKPAVAARRGGVERTSPSEA